MRELASFVWDHPTQLAAAFSIIILVLAAADYCCELFFAHFFPQFFMYLMCLGVDFFFFVAGYAAVHTRRERITCAKHNINQFEVAPECLYAGYMKVAATTTYSVD